MLFANNTLYAWVRNIKTDGTQSRLRYATAKYNQAGSTWSWASWTFTEFGYPVFVQDGQSYASGGTYVYVVAHDSPSAYTPADRFILMRVPVVQILNQTAYEFFSGTPGDPTWASFDQRAQRTAIFTSKGRCYRSGMTYDAARGRYYWWQQIPVPGVDTRFTGGFQVLSAAEPTGPWTTVFHTDSWTLDGPGEKADFPSKYMGNEPIGSAGTVYLLSSSDDTLSIRKGTIAPGF
jgi:predicted DCC family thiol-disulfide oxidoreductase YuxK